MKIAVATSGSGGLGDQVSSIFGRASTFTIVEVERGEIQEVKIIENPGSKVTSGAAVRAVEALRKNNVHSIISGDFGPNAVEMLKAEGMRMVKAKGLVKEVIEKLVEKENL